MQRVRNRQEKGDGFNGDSWSDYFGDSTVYRCCRRGVYVHLAGEDDAETAGAPQEDPADAVRKRLAEDPGDDEA